MGTDRDLRDPELDALLRKHSAETPPPRVDAAILAAAHDAVKRAARGDERAMARQAWRWWMPVAAAAMVGVVVIGILPLAPIAPEERSPTVSDSPVTSAPDAARALPDATPREALAREGGSRAAATDERVSDTAARRREPRETASNGLVPRESRSSQPAVPPGAQLPAAGSPSGDAGQPMTPPAPAASQRERAQAVTPPAAPPATPSQHGRENDAPQTKRDSARPFSRLADGDQTPAPQATETPSSASPARAAAGGLDPTADAAVSGRRSTKLEGATAGAREPGRRDARATGSAERIARIRALRDEGKLAEAILELNAFREAFEDADSRLPDDVRSWARTIAR